MMFMIELEGQTVACSSARCVHGLLREGWRLSDPGQADALLRELARETPLPLATNSAGPHDRSH